MGKWSSIVGQNTKDKAKLAKQLKVGGHSVEEIAKKLKLSKSRIYEYLRGPSGKNWNSKK